MQHPDTPPAKMATAPDPETGAEAGGPWLSVLVPVYNAGAYVHACLDSILGQEGLDDGVEVLVLDDASTDDSWARVTRIADQHAGRLGLLRHPCNRGISVARNTLLASARGHYVWYFDSDDVMLAGAVAQLRRVVTAGAPDLVLCDFTYLRERSRLKHRLRGERHRCTFPGPSGCRSKDRAALAAGLLETGQLHVWSKIGRRRLWRQVPFPEGEVFEDVSAAAGLLAATRSFHHVAQPWVGYRQHAASCLATMTPAKALQRMGATERLHAGIRSGDSGGQDRVMRAADCFAMKAFVSLAKHLHGGSLAADPVLAQQLRASFLRMFPDGAKRLLRDWLARGWWVRWWRARRALGLIGLR